MSPSKYKHLAFYASFQVTMQTSLADNNLKILYQNSSVIFFRVHTKQKSTETLEDSPQHGKNRWKIHSEMAMKVLRFSSWFLLSDLNVSLPSGPHPSSLHLLPHSSLFSLLKIKRRTLPY